ncbi:MAG: glycosyltransferase family 2 protein [Muribaculaceae bacterium]
MRKITATIITYNEEKRIEECLKSLQGVADEIIVVDSFSTDKTVEICKQYDCIVSQRKFNGYGAQKQYAVSLSTHSYVLSIDADEILDAELRQEIQRLKEVGFEHRIYGFSRLNHYCNEPIKHCGWSHDFQVRLFDKRYASWNLRDVHEAVIFPGTLLPYPILGTLMHYRCNTHQEYKFKEDKYAAINAQILINEGRHQAIITPYIKWLAQFINIYIVKLGILDGNPGKMIALTMAHSEFIKHRLARRRAVHTKN